MPEAATRAGRPRSVSSEAILAEARRQLASGGVPAFSVRELAKALGIVPGTIHARFGNKHELLAALYLQRIDEAEEVLERLPGRDRSVAALFEAIAPSLSTLRREFVLHFEGDRSGAGPELRPETWGALGQSFGRLSDRLYAAFRTAAAAEGVRVVDGSRARRLVWTAASTLDSPRGARAFHHGDAGYRRFVASSLLRALATSA